MTIGVPTISQAATALSNLALVTPLLNYGYGPVSAIDGTPLANPWLFTYEGENTVDLEAEVTDHYLEDNSTVNQHVALKPELITVHGFKGEVENMLPLQGPAGFLAQAVLGAVTDFQPSFSKSAQNVINQAAQAYQQAQVLANAAVGAWNTVSGNTGPTVIGSEGVEFTNPNQNKQQALFTQIYGYWRQQISQTTPVFFNVQTPWAIFTPCVLMKVRAIQPEDTDELTDFYLTFKMIRYVSTASSPLVAAGRAALSLSPSVNNGTLSLASGPSLADQLAAQGLP
jgi:hypothetical protein